MGKNYAYLFEAHSIQSYIMNGGKLAEMVGASELLETLIGSSGPLDGAMEKLGFSEKPKGDYEFSRRGGGAFYILFTEQEKAIALRDLWSLIAANFAPGLQWIHTVAEGDSQKEAIKSGQEQLRQKRNQPSISLPETNPLIRRNPRTGLPAIGVRKDKGADGKLTAIDAETKAKQDQNSELLTNKFISEKYREATKETWVFPLNLDHDEEKRVFPYKGDNHTIAIIHADGNGLGQILMDLGDTLKDSGDYAKVFSELSVKIDLSTQLAAQKSLQQVEEIKHLNGTLPIRPLILGGDDLTVIIRGDLALEYAKNFLVHFEKETKEQLASLANDYPTIKEHLPEQMTACAGIAFIRSNQPFYLGYQLAESLCGHAKNSSRDTKKNRGAEKIIPSSLAFYHVTTSMIAQYADVQKHELTVQIDNKPHLLSLGAYGVGTFAEELPSFTELERLKQTFQNKAVSRGPARHILTLMHANPSQAKQAYKRWKEMMSSKDESRETLQIFNETCNSLFSNRTQKEEIPFADFSKPKEKDPLYRTFLGDLTSWLAIEGEQQ